jgi:hypothetical protein
MKPKSIKDTDDVGSESAASSSKMANSTQSAAQKRLDALEVKPKLNLALKLQVTKKDLK